MWADVKHRARSGGLLPTEFIVVSALVLCALSCAAGFVLADVLRRPTRAAVSTVPAAGSPELTTSREREREASPRAPCATPLSHPATHATTLAGDLTSTLRGRLKFQRVEGQLLEAQLNAVNDFLVGAVHALRLVEPQVFRAMADEWEDDICSGTHKEDVNLMLFARLGTIEADIASPKALSCALDGRPQEDIVLWSLLRAWNAKGRPNIAPIDAIRSAATDERTRELLMPPEERRRVQLEQAKKDLEVARTMRSREVGGAVPSQRDRIDNRRRTMKFIHTTVSSVFLLAFLNVATAETAHASEVELCCTNCVPNQVCQAPWYIEPDLDVTPFTAWIGSDPWGQWIGWQDPSGHCEWSWLDPASGLTRGLNVFALWGDDTMFMVGSGGATVCGFPLQPLITNGFNVHLNGEYGEDTIIGGAAPGFLSGQTSSEVYETFPNYIYANHGGTSVIGADGPDWIRMFATPASGSVIIALNGNDDVAAPKRGTFTFVDCGDGSDNYCGPSTSLTSCENATTVCNTW